MRVFELPKAGKASPTEELTLQSDVLHFSIYQNMICFVLHSKEILKAKILNNSIMDLYDAKRIKIEGHESKTFHTVLSFNGYTAVAGTAPSDRKSHNTIKLYNHNLNYLGAVSFNEISPDIALNPIHSLKGVMKKGVTFVIGVYVYYNVSMCAILDNTLVTLVRNARMSASRINGVCLSDQYRSNVLLYGYNEFAVYKF